LVPLSGFEQFLITAEYYKKFAAQEDKFLKELSGLDNLLPEFLIPIQPSLEASKLFLPKSFINYTNLPSRAVLKICKRTLTINIIIYPEIFHFYNLIPTASKPLFRYKPIKKNFVISNQHNVRPKISQQLTSEPKYMYIVLNEQVQIESPNNFYDLINSSLLEASINFNNEL
jgi:hypothetical protein